MLCASDVIASGAHELSTTDGEMGSRPLQYLGAGYPLIPRYIIYSSYPNAVGEKVSNLPAAPPPYSDPVPVYPSIYIYRSYYGMYLYIIPYLEVFKVLGELYSRVY
jgi:hypothetical protein